ARASGSRCAARWPEPPIHPAERRAERVERRAGLGHGAPIVQDRGIVQEAHSLPHDVAKLTCWARTNRPIRSLEGNVALAVQRERPNVTSPRPWDLHDEEWPGQKRELCGRGGPCGGRESWCAER